MRLPCMSRVYTLGLALSAFLFTGGGCEDRGTYLDPPSLRLQTEMPGPPPTTFTITNGAGKVLVDGQSANPLTDAVTVDPPLSDLDGTLSIVLVRPNGQTVTQTLTHEPGRPVRIAWDQGSQSYQIAAPRAASVRASSDSEVNDGGGGD